MPDAEATNEHEQSDDQDHEAIPVMCCLCRKIKTADDAWIETETVIPEEVHVSHGYCPPCAAATLEKATRRE